MKCFAQDAKRVLKKEFDIISMDSDEYYCHPTIRVRSLSEYIRAIEAVSRLKSQAVDWDTIVFRGLPDKKYTVEPGLARVKSIEEDLEERLVSRFRARRPDAFVNLNSFDILAKMQHYGLPTRLLDFTLNPLVALYFACESKPSLDGRVLFHGSFLMSDSYPFVRAICDAAVNTPLDENYTLEEYICSEIISVRRYMSLAYIVQDTTVVRPKYWNQRITNQSGVFMLFPNNLRDQYMRILIRSKEIGVEKAIKEYGHKRINEDEIMVAAKYEPINVYSKKYKGYVTGEIYKEMCNAYKGIEAEEDYWRSLGHRLYLLSELKPIEKQKIRNQFCSIIIDKNDKKRMIQSLSQIGISEDYIYPELEYTAKAVRKQYELNQTYRWNL